MNEAYFSAISALSGSAIGAFASLATTWLTYAVQERGHRHAQTAARKEQLYGEFIEEASRLFSDALAHELNDLSKFVRLYALIGKLRLFAPSAVLAMADQVMIHIVKTYENPKKDFHAILKHNERDLDILRTFSETCRNDLKM